MRYKKIAVIGSGASGISAIRVLVNHGFQVTLFDGGVDVDEDALAKKRATSIAIRRGGLPDDVEPLDYSTLETPRKTYFSSDFSQRPHPSLPIRNSHTVGMLPSFAVGGLTNVWGASALRFREGDIASWPGDTRRLDQWYQEVLAWMPTIGPVSQPPFSTQPINVRSPDGQVGRILESLKKQRAYRKTFLADESSLAVSPKPSDCERCGLCLSGCPFDYIFSSRHELGRLPRHLLEHYSGHVVTSLHEIDEKVVISTDNGMGKKSRFDFDGVLVGAGVIQSSSLVMNALGIREGVRIQDCQAFTIPLLTAFTKSSQHPSMTLAEGVLDLLDDEGVTSEAYVQIYPGGRELAFAADLFAKRLHLPEPIRRSLVRHSLAAHGFLPGSQSHELTVRIESSSTYSIQRILVDSVSNPSTHRAMKRVIGRVFRMMGRAGALVITPLVHAELPGRSYHIGSSFPMSEHPVGLQSDLLGRPVGLRRVHVIDASVLPSLPPQSPTLTVMANATRIATLLSNHES